MSGIDGFTKLMLHCDGIDGSTIFTDSSENVKTITANGDAQIDTAYKKFGTASGLFDGNGDYLTVPDDDDWYFGSGDFTIDFWVRFNVLPSSGSNQYLLTQATGTDNNNRWLFVLNNNSGTYRFRFLAINSGITDIDCSLNSLGLSTGTWYHIALVRYGNSMKIYQAGTSLGSLDVTGKSSGNYTGLLIIGRRHAIDITNWYYINGWLDEVRISKGIARWTSNFTPPTEPYTPVIKKNITSDAHIKITNINETIISDALISLPKESILSDALIVNLVLYNISNKFNFVKIILSDINNRINTVKRVLSDINNFVNTCKSVIFDTLNDFRTKKLILNNIENDIRFMYSWQKAADGTIQSLGKGYIKVYIGGIEQTDVDVDSINISKDLSVAHNATFDLGRAYDSTKPTMESTVSIKYNDWVLFAGYITQIAPAEDPEKIRIICQDEYWKQNKTNVYYHVGHQPIDNKELYYNTLKEALTIQHNWTPGPGNFTPETLDNFAVGKSDAISSLIREMGNYEWFYDVDGNKKLWIAGEGSIINLERQILGENINLYDVINHSFEESVENIVNKFRVQMGDKVIRKFDSTGGSRTYTGYNYSSFQGFLTPAWESSYETLAVDSIDGYGWDYPEPGYEKEYGEVFKKYNIPYLDPKLSAWSDRYPPRIEIHTPGGYHYSSIGEITEGFTIDYENRIITFNTSQFLYKINSYGELITARAPLLKLFLWKKNYYTFTLDPSDDPESDISNPLMFFTSKMGSYPDTIIKDLNLSSLSIQEGGVRTLPDGTVELIPSWDDTAFAEDIANWKLSQSCDKKIRGNIIITLDAICFYNIDLTKRIYIDGITDEPMNITSINYNISNFTVNLTLENSRSYNRTISFGTHGE